MEKSYINNPSPLLKPVEVARRLSISRELVYRLIQTGSLPSVRFNRTVRVQDSDLEAFIQKNWTGRQSF